MIFFKEDLPDEISEDQQEKLFSDKNISEVIARNIRLAIFIANKHDGLLDDEELLLCALFALVKAANSFNSEAGVKFSTFASRCIENEILYRLRGENKHKKTVSIDQIASTAPDGTEFLLKNILPDEKSENLFKKFEDRELIKRLVSVLSEEEKRILCMWVDGKTQKEIGSDIGVGQPQVNRLLKRIFEKMREKCPGRS